MNINQQVRQRLNEFAQELKPTVFTEGQEIYTSCDQEPKVGFIVSGLVKCQAGFKYQTKNKHPTIYLFGTRYWFGFESFVDDTVGYKYISIATTQAVLLDSDWVVNEMSSDLRLGALMQYAITFRRFSAMHVNQGYDAKRRLLSILTYIRRVTDTPEVALTLTDIGGIIGTSKANVSPIMKELEREGIVERGYRRYWIADLRKIYKAYDALGSA